MTLKLQEVANFGMFFHVMQTIHFIHVCLRFMNRVYSFSTGLGKVVGLVTSHIDM